MVWLIALSPSLMGMYRDPGAGLLTWRGGGGPTVGKASTPLTPPLTGGGQRPKAWAGEGAGLGRGDMCWDGSTDWVIGRPSPIGCQGVRSIKVSVKHIHGFDS